MSGMSSAGGERERDDYRQRHDSGVPNECLRYATTFHVSNAINLRVGCY